MVTTLTGLGGLAGNTRKHDQTEEEASSHRYSLSVKDHGVSDTRMKPWDEINSDNEKSEDAINNPKDRKKTLNRWKD